MNASMLRMSPQPYVVIMRLHVISPIVTSEDEVYSIPVSLLVSAQTVASSTVWGRVGPAQACKRNTTRQTMVSRVGVPSSAGFQACDHDLLPVANEIPNDEERRYFIAQLTRIAPRAGLEAIICPINYVGLGFYEVIIETPTTGTFALDLSLVEDDTSSVEPTSIGLSVRADCPPGESELPTLACGCNPGTHKAECRWHLQ
eukprot:3768055-Prymnesium_polylepis.1